MKKIRMGMVGGGEGAFIGAVHRIAAFLDGSIELVCGAFSSDAQRCIASGKALYLPEHRCYATYQEMMIREAQLAPEQRMEFVVIVTPNHLHFPVAKMAIEYGFHVLSDKPATTRFDEALLLRKLLEQHDVLYGLTQTYTGYPLIKQARHLIAQGELGNIVKVVVEYSQGWLALKEDEVSKQASWRLDASKSGISCCMGDIGVHAANLVEYVAGITITALCADLTSTVAGRILDDDGTVILKFSNGAKGVLLASQIAIGDENNLSLRIYGDRKSIEWSQLDPNTLWLKSNTEASQMIRSGVGEMCPAARQAMRTPAGHPEGYLEAFANIYSNFVRQIRAKQAGQVCDNRLFDVPGIEEAIRGMAFIENVVKANDSDTKWQAFTLGTDTNVGEG
ncbi:Gfo/Idh/MocA family oxidoreductase [Shewanella sp. D64]|uniref:Gfo/Idh/MocA family protein n=1 Tax=unclassified Shewanella TaxID=196818 RepID=UPI0022BA5BE6|nr:MULTISPECIES: Gfo/Idh/MocA family oxidoreductase [unclassified Shewanella]MEC4725481.1 Gfo/Idh/MocA family oxidoreductase [Shewanella sp. D64]MEC4738700.1 Gfo/Idh/MocA family oxidoreductase [Shewanella sp. E94]WBJ94996.1 Gfo/Idh/MocA family oxidoreductase [Shewanella sp. MTB7]